MLKVMKPIPHPSRRFNPGDEIAEADLAGCAIELRELRVRGFLSGGLPAVTVVVKATDPVDPELSKRLEQAMSGRAGRRR